MASSNKLLRSLAAFAAVALIGGASVSPVLATDNDDHDGKSKYHHHYKSSKYSKYDDEKYDEGKCKKYKKYAEKYADDDDKLSKYSKYAKYCHDDDHHGGGDHHNGHSPKLVIQEIFVDQPTTGQMTILGVNFGAAPRVRFGTETDDLVISSVSSANGIDSIVADLPADIPLGDYLVTVSSKANNGHGWHDDDDDDHDNHHGHGNRRCDENSACADEYDLTIAAPADSGGGGADPLTTRILCDVCRALNNDSNPGLFLACGQFLDRAEETNACPIIQ